MAKSSILEVYIYKLAKYSYLCILFTLYTNEKAITCDLSDPEQSFEDLANIYKLTYII